MTPGLMDIFQTIDLAGKWFKGLFYRDQSQPSSLAL